MDPDILIVDEVLAVGDLEFQMRCRDRLMRDVTEGRTIILVSHSIALVQDLCQEYAIWLDKGVIYGAGDVHTVTGLYRAFVHNPEATYPMPVEADESLTDRRRRLKRGCDRVDVARRSMSSDSGSDTILGGDKSRCAGGAGVHEECSAK